MFIKIFIFIIIVLFIWVCIKIGSSVIDAAQPDFSESFINDANDGRKRINKEVEKVQQNLLKELSVQTEPEYIMLIKAVIDNLLYIKKKEYQMNVVRKWNNEQHHYKNAKQFIEKLKHNINHTGSVVKSDFRNLVNEEVYESYKQLSRSYDRLKIDVPRQIETSGFNVDISNSKFFHVSVGNINIPRFNIKSDDDKVFYIYPTVCVESIDREGLKAYPIDDVNISFSEINQDGKTTIILNIDKIETHIVIDDIEKAIDFCNAFNTLKGHAIEYRRIKKSTPEVIEKREEEINKSLLCLDSFTGLKTVKQEFYNIANFIKVQLLRKSNRLKTIPISYHYVFIGNPGTGKTTMARVLADLYKELGVVSKGQLIETDRAGLVAEYVGQTAVKTNAIIDEAIGGVLFIDEAYSLTQGGKDDFGNEAITTLLKRMEDERDNLIVILAGYPDEMKSFIESNPGLQSRFNRYIEFEDYTPEELFDIFCSYCEENEYELASESKTILENLMQNVYETRDRNFGNARFVRNMFEKVCQKQADRIVKIKDPTKKDMTLILPQDL